MSEHITRDILKISFRFLKEDPVASDDGCHQHTREGNSLKPTKIYSLEISMAARDEVYYLKRNMKE